MRDCNKSKDIEVLAKMAARLAGRDPDEHLRMELAEVVAFDDVLWRYPDFLTRAEAAYHVLTTPNLTVSQSAYRQPSAITGSHRPKRNVAD